MLRDLENFIAMKQKHEIYKDTLEKRKNKNPSKHEFSSLDRQVSTVS